MSVIHEIKDKEMKQVNGGKDHFKAKAGYWYKVYASGRPFPYEDEKYGIATEAERDQLLAEAIAYITSQGGTNIQTSKGYIAE